MFRRFINYIRCILDFPIKGDKTIIEASFGIDLEYPTCIHCETRLMGTQDLGWVHYKRGCPITD
jgi:hypothetical protein